jgi:hypothetical protein
MKGRYEFEGMFDVLLLKEIAIDRPIRSLIISGNCWPNQTFLN